MKPPHKRMFITALTLSCALTAPLAAAAPAKQPGHWAQDYAGQPADPNVRFGTLANGLRYAIIHNERPEQAVSFRMRIGAGSLQERDEERGLAHYLEHMAFRGSTNVADGEVVKMLERQGLRFGPDTNAFTSFDQTVYMFDFPHADASALETGLTLFREIGGRLKLDPAAIDAERGVVLSEERLRDTPGYRLALKTYQFGLAGQRVPTRFPIGTIATIKGADATKLRRYYEANYRPDNATIVVAGAVDVDKVEAQIKARFADWQSAGQGAPVDLGTVAQRGTQTDIFSEHGAPEKTIIGWVRPFNDAPDTLAREQLDMHRQLGLAILNRRLQERAQGADAPFVSAAVESEGVIKSADSTQIEVASKPGRSHEALLAAMEEQRRIVRDGVSAAEITALTEKTRTDLKNALAGASTRLNSTIAEGLAEAANDDAVYTNPAQDLEHFEQFVVHTSKADVDAALQKIFSGSGPLVLRATPDATVTRAMLAADIDAALKAPVAKVAETQVAPWPYTNFGTPPKDYTRAEIADLGITVVTFPNGTKLAVKPTNFSKDSIQVRVDFGQGRLGIPANLTHSDWLLSSIGHGLPFLLGGTGKRDVTQIQRETESNVTSIELNSFDDRFTLSGTTRKADFRLQMQLLAAYATDPAYRPEGVARSKDVALTQLPTVEATPGAVFSREISLLSHNGDARWTEIPRVAQVAPVTAADLKALLNDGLQSPKMIAIVGDVTVEDAIKMTAETFGALPAGKAQVPVSKTSIHIAPAQDTPLIFHHLGREDQAIVAQYWPQDDYFTNPKNAYALNIASAIVRSRLTELAREKLGLTYSPRAASVQSTMLPGYGYWMVLNETKPAFLNQFITMTNDALIDLAAKGPTADEFTRAQKPLIDSRQKATETNGFWLGSAALVLTDPRAETMMRDYVKGIAAITPADVQRVVSERLAGKKSLVVEVVAGH